MARRSSNEAEGGVDSFLDVITNIVGILIILVMVVAERARSTPIEVPTGPSQELVAAQAKTSGLENEIRELSRQMAIIQAETQARAHERSQLSLLIAAIEQEIEKRRALLDENSQQRYETDRELAIARDELSRLEQQRQQLEKSPPAKTVTIANEPTPISKKIEGAACTIRLCRGRVAIVPTDALQSWMWQEINSQMMVNGGPPEFTGVVGPMGGFRMRYLVRRGMSESEMLPVTQKYTFTFLTVSSQVGEPLAQALQPTSEFRKALTSYSPQQYAMSVWVYQDSFGDFTTLRKELYALGYSVAAFPAELGHPVAISNEGYSSQAQ